MSSATVDPDAPGLGDGLYGLPSDAEGALFQVIPVPWEATASYGRGTRGGPAAVLAASAQVDLEDTEYGPIWERGIAWLPVHDEIAAAMEEVEGDALAVIAAGGVDASPGVAPLAARVDAVADAVHARVEALCAAAFDAGQVPVVLGGDHSCPLPLLRAAAARHPGLGVLHIDAHADLRDAYLGFRHSHASIMHNTLALPGVSALVGVAWRDLGRRELRRIHAEPRIRAFLDEELGRRQVSGEPWSAVVDEIVDALPPQVHISFDIDGLDPTLCPETGTPVPGGLRWPQAMALLRAVAARREVVSFDLCEVAPGVQREDGRDGWDAIVGARLLYKLCGVALMGRQRREQG
jgi:agmatinase